MAEVISLFNYGAGDDVGNYPYIIFDSKLIDVGIFSVSPEVMSLGEDLFVADISVASSYWKKVAKMKNLSLSEVYSSTLQKDATGAALIVFCDHPLQGLILYKYLKEKGVEGAYESNSDFTKRAYKNVDWALWTEAALVLDSVFESDNRLVKERRSFRSSLARLGRFASRIKIQTFSDLKKTEFYEIQRRFGPFIGLLWKWTFPKAFKQVDSEPDLFSYSLSCNLRGFEWIRFKPLEPIVTKSDLEYTMSTWAEIEPELVKNLKQISKSNLLKNPVRISEYVWVITLFDASEVVSKIQFKHPLAIAADTDFETSLSQLKIAFERFQIELSEKTKDTDLANVPLIIGWTLEVSGKVRIDSDNGILFFEEEKTARKAQNVKNFESKLENNSMGSFRLISAPVPALDYADETEEGRRSDFSTGGALRYLIKPLFIYPDPEKIEPSLLVVKKFLDRTASSWWESGDTEDSYRDYFMCETGSGELLWVYRNYKGDWYVHGIYS